MTDGQQLGRGALWTGRVLTGVVAAFLLADGGLRVAGFAPYVEGLATFGYPTSLAPAIGLSLLIPTILYLIPRTAALGAILITGYLGGATATQVRVGDDWFLFPVGMAILAWLGLWLRDPRLKALLPLSRPDAP